MAVIEILTYSPFNMDIYLPFVKVGKPKAEGGFETDGQGRMKIGVLRWLLGREVPEAHFFSTPQAAPLKLFMALIQRPGAVEVPWMGRIAGFDEMIRIDGLTGQTSSFGPISDLLASLISNTDLDNAFAEGKVNVQRVLDQIAADPTRLSVNKDEFLRTLRSEVGTNPKAVFDEVLAKLGISL